MTLSLFGHWDASRVTSGGGQVTAMADDGSGGNALDFSAAPALVASTSVANHWPIANLPLVELRGASRGVAGAASSWKMLTDGSGLTLYFVYRATVASGAQAQEMILSCYNGSSAEIGLHLAHDSQQERLEVSLTNGDGQGSILTYRSFPGSVKNLYPHVVSLRWKSNATVGAGSEVSQELSLRVDGVPVLEFCLGVDQRSGAPRASPLAANPSRTLTIGSLNPSGNALNAELGELGIAKRYATDTEIGQKESDVAQAYGLTLGNRTAIVFFDGNSLTSESGGQPGGPDYPALALPSGANISILAQNRAIYGMRTGEMLARVPKHVDRIFLAPPRNAPPGSVPCVYVGWEIINDLADLIAGGDPDPVGTALKHYAALMTKNALAGFRNVAVTIPINVGITAAQCKAVNDGIRKNNAFKAYAERLADVGADPHIGENGDPSNLTYFQADGVHLTALSKGTIVSPLVKTELIAIVGGS